MKLQIPKKTWKEGEDPKVEIDGKYDIKVRFIKDSTGKILIRIFLRNKPRLPICVSIYRFFQGTVTEEFIPKCFSEVEKGLYFAERGDFPQQIFAEMLESDTVRVGVEEVLYLNGIIRE
jgi:hypothetical protein